MNRLSAAAFLILTACAPSSSLAQAEHSDLTVRVRKLTPELVAAIENVGEERSLDAPAGTDILKVVTEYCGSANARRDYLRVFLAANASNPEIQGGSTILRQSAVLKIPACLFANEQPVAVLATSSGIRWDEPVSVPKELLGSVQKLKWIPEPTDANKLRKYPFAKRLPGQRVKADRLKSMTSAGLPDELDQKGLELIHQIDSGRLVDPTVRSAYEEVVKKAIAYTPDQPSTSLTYFRDSRASVDFEQAVRTQDVLASNASVDLNRLGTGSALISSDFVPGQYTVKLRSNADPKTAGRLVLAALTSKDPSGEVAVTSGYMPYLDPPCRYCPYHRSQRQEPRLTYSSANSVCKLRTDTGANNRHNKAVAPS